MELLGRLDIPSTCDAMQARALQTPPLSALVEKRAGIVDKTRCYQLIQLLIITTNEYFGVNWSDAQVTEFAKNFYSQFFYWTMADVKLFFNRLKQGYYGTVWGQGFIPAKVSELALQYNEEWFQESERLAVSNHNSVTGLERRASTDDRKRSEQEAREFHQVLVDQYNRSQNNQEAAG